MGNQESISLSKVESKIVSSEVVANLLSFFARALARLALGGLHVATQNLLAKGPGPTMDKHVHLVLVNGQGLESLSIKYLFNLLEFREVIATTDGAQDLQMLLA